jgi:osmoprotectant transport system permease protein
MSAILADSGVTFSGVGKYLTTGSNWWGINGLLVHIRDHLIYSAIIVGVAALIALPIGLIVGHTGRGVVAVVGVANALRAVPTLGLIVLLYVWLAPKIPVNHGEVLFLLRGAVPTFVAVVAVLILLAVPPILTNTYAGIQAVDPAVRDAARGMGMRGSQVLRRVELPCALPLIMSGLRSATLQVIATVTVAAYLPGLGGLGRYIADGAEQAPQQGDPPMLSAALLVAILALVIDALLNLIQRLIVSPGVSGRYSTKPGVTSSPVVEAQLTLS